MQLRGNLLRGGVALVAALTLAMPVSALAAEVAKIGDTSYETLDAAVDAVQADQEIDLEADAELTVGYVTKPVTINGAGHEVSVPNQGNTGDGDGRLEVRSTLTFSNAKVKFDNDKGWSLVVSADGVLNLNQGAECSFTNHGIYMLNGATINADASKLTVDRCKYTGIMGEGYGLFNATNGSVVTITNNSRGDGVPNGTSRVKFSIKDSELVVEGNENQGLVRSPLSLDNSTASISGNDIGITGYNKTEVLTMKNGSKLSMSDNKSAGIFLWGGTVDVQSGCELSITGTGKNSNYTRFDEDNAEYYGALVLDQYYDTYAGTVTFADGAYVTITNNALGGINNKGETVNLGANTIVTNNGGDRVPNGGGIYNNGGTVTVAEGAQAYNNHAKISGDDIANLNGGSLALAATGSDWVLDDCDHAITCWFDDTEDARWNAHSKDADIHVDEVAVATFTDEVYLKAAHGLAIVDYKWVSTDNPTGVNPPASDKDLEFGVAYTAKAQDAASGWTFDGWYVDEACTTKWTDGRALPGSMTLYGKWSKNATPTPAPTPTPKSPEQAATKIAKKSVPKTGDPASIAGIAVSALAGGAALLAARKARRK